MKLMAVLIVLFGLRFVAAEEATQTDWSGGSGVLGPVPAWEDRFYSAAEIDWLSCSGQLCLSQSVVEHDLQDSFDGTASVYACDLDDDGRTDILSASYTNASHITWWHNAGGDPIQWYEETIDAGFVGALGVSAGDVDNDGDIDVLGAGFSAGISWWENDGSDPISWIAHDVDPAFSGAHSVVGSDLDGDGDLDLAGAANIRNEIAWWENMGGNPVAWQKHTVDAVFMGTQSVYAYDIDNDGDEDLIGAAFNDAEIRWWRNDGGTPIGWYPQTVGSGFGGAHCAFAADIDGDGDGDALGAGFTVNDIAWWRNDGGEPTTWVQHTIDGNVSGALMVHAADMDSDDDMDVLGTAWNGDDVKWWENVDGLGTSWAEHTIDGSFNGAWPVVAADVNSDGCMDVIAAADVLSGQGPSDDISWWELQTYAEDGQLTSSILDLGNTPQSGWINWTAAETPGTLIFFRLRSSNDAADLGGWSEDILISQDISYLLGQYVQYRAVLETTDPHTTPFLEDVSITWDPMDVGDAFPMEMDLELRIANPAQRKARIEIYSVRDCSAQLSLYGLGGRQVMATQQHLHVGRNTIQLCSLLPGMYVCWIEGSGTSVSHPLVIID
jgi:hypothetical protein